VLATISAVNCVIYNGTCPSGEFKIHRNFSCPNIFDGENKFKVCFKNKLVIGKYCVILKFDRKPKCLYLKTQYICNNLRFSLNFKLSKAMAMKFNVLIKLLSFFIFIF
jgi:hypothetical protein